MKRNYNPFQKIGDRYTRVYRNEEFTEKDVQTLLGLGAGEGGSGGGAAPAGGAPAAGTGSSAAPAAGAAAPAAGGEAGGSAAPAAGQGGAAPAADEVETHELESLGFKSIDEIKSMRENYARIEKELNEAKGQPKFASDRAKMLYEFANRFEGMELDKAREYLEIVNLDLTKQADHQLRFRAYQLKPELKGYSQDEIAALFADEELKNFGDPNVEGGQTEIQKIRAKGATLQAREAIEKLQNEYKSQKGQADSRTPEELAADKAAYTNHVKEQLTKFDGIALKLTATSEDGKKVEGNLNFKLDAEKQLPAIVNAVVDPSGWWENYLAKQGVIAPGSDQVNVQKFGEIVARLEYMEELLNQTYNQGRNDQTIQYAQTHRNPGGAGEGGAPAGGGGAAKTEHQEMTEGALKSIGLGV